MGKSLLSLLEPQKESLICGWVDTSRHKGGPFARRLVGRSLLPAALASASTADYRWLLAPHFVAADSGLAAAGSLAAARSNAAADTLALHRGWRPDNGRGLVAAGSPAVAAEGRAAVDSYGAADSLLNCCGRLCCRGSPCCVRPSRYRRGMFIAGLVVQAL